MFCVALLGWAWVAFHRSEFQFAQRSDERRWRRVVILADIAKELLPPILIRPMQAVSRKFSQSPADVYVANGRRPWTFGYRS